jgi:hypothetical protein
MGILQRYLTALPHITQAYRRIISRRALVQRRETTHNSILLHIIEIRGQEDRGSKSVKQALVGPHGVFQPGARYTIEVRFVVADRRVRRGPAGREVLGEALSKERRATPHCAHAPWRSAGLRAAACRAGG